MSITHSQACMKRQLELAAYTLKWPNYCRICDGTGIVTSPGDWVPYGMGSAQLPDDAEPCSCAQDDGKCPRCNTPIIWHDDPDEAHIARGHRDGYFEPCPKCGLVSGEVAPEDAAPSAECECALDGDEYDDYMDELDILYGFKPKTLYDAAYQAYAHRLNWQRPYRKVSWRRLTDKQKSDAKSLARKLKLL